MANFRQATPCLNVPNFDETVAFFTDVLGFEAETFGFSGYAYLDREGVGIRVAHKDAPIPEGEGWCGVYIDVWDVDALYAELEDKLAHLPPGDVEGPVDRFYGQRELLIRAPFGKMITFGHDIDCKEAGR